jgi:hypothetical protein
MNFRTESVTFARNKRAPGGELSIHVDIKFKNK